MPTSSVHPVEVKALQILTPTSLTPRKRRRKSLQESVRPVISTQRIRLPPCCRTMHAWTLHLTCERSLWHASSPCKSRAHLTTRTTTVGCNRQLLDVAACQQWIHLRAHEQQVSRRTSSLYSTISGCWPASARQSTSGLSSAGTSSSIAKYLPRLTAASTGAGAGPASGSVFFRGLNFIFVSASAVAQACAECV